MYITFYGFGKSYLGKFLGGAPPVCFPRYRNTIYWKFSDIIAQIGNSGTNPSPRFRYPAAAGESYTFNVTMAAVLKKAYPPPQCWAIASLTGSGSAFAVMTSQILKGMFADRYYATVVSGNARAGGLPQAVTFGIVKIMPNIKNTSANAQINLVSLSTKLIVWVPESID
jgi:hypothetical protein